MKRKICVVVTARASYSRIKTLLLAIKTHPLLTLQLVVTGSILLEKYGFVLDLILRDGFDEMIRVSNLLDNENPTAAAKTAGLGVIELASIFENIRPDVVVTVADRYETMSAAIAASFMNIPLAHIQGGEVTGNIDEKVRHAVSKLADIHFVATEAAQNRLIAMGEIPENVWQTGCPSIDLALQMKQDGAMHFDYESCGSFRTSTTMKGQYLIVMQHPVTTENASVREQFNISLQAIEALEVPAFWFTPNSDCGAHQIFRQIEAFKETHKGARIHFLRNLSPDVFLKLLKNCSCLIGNSSTGLREGAFLGTPVVNIGNRQCRRDRAANVIDVQHDKDAIIEAVKNQLAHGHYASDFRYGTGDAGNKIAELLATIPLNINKQITY